MHIRKAAAADLPAILEIYAGARDFMRANGNPTQWKDYYPPAGMIVRDIELGVSYVCVGDCACAGAVESGDVNNGACAGAVEGGDVNKGACDGEVLAVFYFNIERDPTYEKIAGAWLNDAACGVVHRIAVARGGNGVGAFCLGWCFEQCGNIKIDTHKDNRPMRALLEKLGYAYCGIIWVLDGTEERMAYQLSNAV